MHPEPAEFDPEHLTRRHTLARARRDRVTDGRRAADGVTVPVGLTGGPECDGRPHNNRMLHTGSDTGVKNGELWSAREGERDGRNRRWRGAGARRLG